MAVKRDLTMYQGATYKRTITYANTKSGPINLSGCKFRVEIVPSTVPAGQRMTLTSEQGHILITNPTKGEFQIHLKPEITATFNWTKAKYQLYLIYPNGDVVRLIEGVINCSRMI